MNPDWNGVMKERAREPKPPAVKWVTDDAENARLRKQVADLVAAVKEARWVIENYAECDCILETGSTLKHLDSCRMAAWLRDWGAREEGE